MTFSDLLIDNPRTMPGAILWDMDGVLIDSEPGYNEAIGELIRSLGYKFGEREIEKTTGVSFRNIAEMLDIHEPPETLSQRYADALMHSVRSDVHGLIDGVSDFLDYFKSKGIKMAIGSSSPRELVDFVVKRFDLSHWLDLTVTGSDTENGKPAPDIYLLCAERLGIPVSECLVIEDSRNGILSAKNAGMRVMAYTGTNRHDLDLSEADFIFSSYSRDSLAAVDHWLTGTKTGAQ